MSLIKRTKPLILVAFLPLTLLLAGQALDEEKIEGTDYVDRSIQEIAAASDVIIAGRIVKVMSVERENELAEHSYNQKERIEIRLAWIEVDGVLRGPFRKGQRVRLAYPARARLAGEPVYELEQQGIWFLRRSSRRGEYLADHPNRLQPLRKADRIKAIVEAMKTTDGSSNGNGRNRTNGNKRKSNGNK